MIEAGIYDNDVVVVDRDTRPAQGHIVIAIVDGGFVCRQLVERRGCAFLEARNSQQCYKPTSAEGVEYGASCGQASATTGASGYVVGDSRRL